MIIFHALPTETPAFPVPTEEEPKQYLGEVEFFYSARDEDEEGDVIEMAYVRTLKVVRDGPLWRLAGGFAAAVDGGAHEVIRCDDIVGLSGLLKRGREMYVVGKDGALGLEFAEEVETE